MCEGEKDRQENGVCVSIFTENAFAADFVYVFVYVCVCVCVCVCLSERHREYETPAWLFERA